MRMNKSKLYKSIVSGTAAVAVVCAMLVSWVPDDRPAGVRADWSKNKDNTRLDTTKILNPSGPEVCDWAWEGNYIYYGCYSANPIKFRVLSTYTKEYGGKTVFLDSDRLLFNYNHNGCYWHYDDNGVRKAGPLNRYLNNEFMIHAFTNNEIKNINRSYNEDKFAPLNGEKVFVLYDSEFIPVYGYSSASGKTTRTYTYDYYETDFNGNKVKKQGTATTTTYYSVKNRCKKYTDNSEGCWWLRYGYVNQSGYKESTTKVVNGNNVVMEYDYGVAPAINIDRDSIMMVSLVSGTQEKVGAEYKLTMLDKDINVSVQAGKMPYAVGNKLTIPYEVKGIDASIVDRISVMITNDYYEPGNPNEAEILYYGSLDNTFSSTNGQFITKGEGSITLPSSFNVKDWGYRYLVYLIAEDANDSKITDYAGMPVELTEAKVMNGSTNTGSQNISGSDDSSIVGRTANNSDTNTSTNGNRASGQSSTNPGNDGSGSQTVYTGTIGLDKTQADVICGKTISLKTTGGESSSSVVWKSSNNSIATVDSNGIVKAKKAGKVTISATAGTKRGTCTVTVLYKDVTDYSAFWFEPTNYLTAKGVVQGYDKQTKFKPANYCTRAQMVTFIWRLEGQPSPKSDKCKFSDVKSSDYFYKACIWGNENHIVEGYKDGSFKPQKTCARKHAVTFLWRLAGHPEPSNNKNKFSDVKSSDYFYKATLWASEKKILAGYSDGTFRPNGDCLRRQMVTFLSKYDQYVKNK